MCVLINLQYQWWYLHQIRNEHRWNRNFNDLRQTSDLIQTLMIQRQAVLRLVISVRWPGLSACKYLLLNVIQKTQHTDNDVRNSVIWCVVNSFRPKYCLLFTYNEKHPLFSWHQLTTHYLMLTKEAEVCLPSRSQLYNRCLVSPGRCCVQIYLRGVRICHHSPPTHTPPIMGKYKHCLRIFKTMINNQRKPKIFSFNAQVTSREA